MKVKFIKVKPGEDLHNIYFPLLCSNDYQLISNIDKHGGEIMDNPGSLDNYVRFTILSEKQTAEGEWGEVILDFDYVSLSTEFTYQQIVFLTDTPKKLRFSCNSYVISRFL